MTRTTLAAAWLLAGALVALSAVKLAADYRPTYEIMGLADALRARPTMWAAACIELLLGVGMASRWRAIAIRGVVAWLTVLTGILVAVVVARIPLAACGCFGSRSASLASRLAVLAGLWALTLVMLTNRATESERRARE